MGKNQMCDDYAMQSCGRIMNNDKIKLRLKICEKRRNRSKKSQFIHDKLS